MTRHGPLPLARAARSFAVDVADVPPLTACASLPSAGSRAGPRFAPHSLLRPIARRALSAPPAPKEESQLAGALFFGSIVALTVGLGTWQSQRYTWKVELTERRHANLAQPPVPLSEALADSVDPGSRRVLLRGRFDHAHEVLVGPRPPPKDLPATFTQRETTGFAVVTPFVPNDGCVGRGGHAGAR